MKKLYTILVSFIAFFVVGCSNVEKVDNSEYVSKHVQTLLNCSSEVFTSPNEYYDSSFTGIEDAKAVKTFLESTFSEICSFTSNDKDLNKLHNDLIDANLDLVKKIDKFIDLMESGDSEQASKYLESDVSDALDSFSTSYANVFEYLNSQGINSKEYFSQFGIDFLF